MNTELRSITCPDCGGSGEGGTDWSCATDADDAPDTVCERCEGSGDAETDDAGEIVADLRAGHAHSLHCLRSLVRKLEANGSSDHESDRAKGQGMIREMRAIRVEALIFSPLAACALADYVAEIDGLYARLLDLTMGRGGDKLGAALAPHGYPTLTEWIDAQRGAAPEPASTPADAFPAEWDLPY